MSRRMIRGRLGRRGRSSRRRREPRVRPHERIPLPRRRVLDCRRTPNPAIPWIFSSGIQSSGGSALFQNLQVLSSLALSGGSLRALAPSASRTSQA
uniref:Uncharacterized protein n=1 Tax=Oryza meridionalis TaxID=40149 RepID=A0A0E0DMG2_9ORYZ